MSDLEELILDSCFVSYDRPFANGEAANNKIDLELLDKKPELRPLRQRCLSELGNLALALEPDFVTAVPNGANWIAADIAKEHGLGLIRLHKYPDTGEIDFDTEEDAELAEGCERGVLFEDVARTFFSTGEVLALPEFRNKIMAELAILYRGLPQVRPPLVFRALASVYIPPMLPADSPLWRHLRG